jgi:hypothetical protein
VRDGILEGLTPLLESTVSGHFGHQRTVANLAERLIHAVMPHIVSVKKPKNVSRNGRRGNVNVMDSGSVDLTVIRGTIERQPPFYEGVRSVEMGPDIPRRRFVAVVLDAEWDKGGASVVFKARRCWQYGSCSWASSISRSSTLAAG